MKKMIRNQGHFHWYESEGQTALAAPPDNEGGRKFDYGDLVVHRILGGKPRVQVWCWENQRWLPIDVGHPREISKKLYFFNFQGDFAPCWVTEGTLQRRSPTKKRPKM